MKGPIVRDCFRSLAGSILALVIVFTGSAESVAQAIAEPGGPTRVAAHIAESIAFGEPVEALVLLNDANERAAQERDTRLADLPDPGQMSPAHYARRVEDWARRLDAVKSAVKGEVLGGDLDELTEYPQFPILHVRIKSPAALERLRSHPNVLSVDENTANHATLAQSLPLIGQPQAQAAGDTGAGTTVCVLDTGVDYTLPAFGSCAAPGGACKVAFAADIAPPDGSRDDNGHGTNVSAIVLGVAPGARVAVLDVFNGASAFDADIISAINWCVTNRAAYNVVSLNMSFGSGRYYSPLASTDSRGTAIQSAVDAGIVVVAASGNDGHADSLMRPAAYSNVVSVGNVYDSAMGGVSWGGSPPTCTDFTTAADKVTCSSNSASFLTMLAPGAVITAAGITMGGTSQAAPHVAGAAAVIRAANPGYSVPQVKAALGNGQSVMDPRNGIVKPRLYLPTALLLGVDTTPNPFSFTAQTGVALSTAVTSNTTTVNGINTPASISVSGGTYNINGGGYTSAAGTVSNGNTVSVRLTSAANYGTQTCATLSIGGVNGVFCATTTAVPVLPDLVVSALNVPATGVIGGSISISANVTNNGTASAGTYDLGLYFSPDSSITTGDTLFASCASMPVLGAGGTRTCSGTVTVPAGLSPGLYYLGAIADDLAQVAELNESNNTRSAQIVLSMPGYTPVIVARAGNGAGTVTSNPLGIACGTDCFESYATGTSVTLVATPNAGSAFNGWSGGACSGTLICTLTMSAARSVTATFTSAGTGSINANEWVQKAYVAYYGRPADPAGLTFWAQRMDREGGSLASIIAAFGYSDEFNRRYGGLNYSQLVDKLYQQTLGRAPDPAGKQWYMNQLNAGRTTPQTITLDLLGGATGSDTLTVANRLDVANHFSGKVAMGCPYSSELTGVNSLAPVTYDAATVWTAKLATESRCGI